MDSDDFEPSWSEPSGYSDSRPERAAIYIAIGGTLCIIGMCAWAAIWLVPVLLT